MTMHAAEHFIYMHDLVLKEQKEDDKEST